MHLAEYMKLKELDDAEVAKAIKRSRPTVSRIRRNKSRPDWETMSVLRQWSKGKISANDFIEVTSDPLPPTWVRTPGGCGPSRFLQPFG